MKTIVIACQKGGTGKSTIAVHIAMFLAENGHKVAFLNCEVQKNGSNALLKRYPEANVSCDAFFRKEIFPISSEGDITVFEGGGVMADVEKADAKFFKPQVQRLAEHFDYCVIDTPPTAAVLQIAPLIAADFVISPLQMEDFAMQGVADTIKTIIGIKQKYNPDMKYLGILPNLVKGNSHRQRNALVELIRKFPQYCFEPKAGAKIGNRDSIPEALGDGIPVWKLKKTSAKEAAVEMLNVMTLLKNHIEA